MHIDGIREIARRHQRESVPRFMLISTASASISGPMTLHHVRVTGYRPTRKAALNYIAREIHFGLVGLLICRCRAIAFVHRPCSQTSSHRALNAILDDAQQRSEHACIGNARAAPPIALRQPKHISHGVRACRRTRRTMYLGSEHAENT